jgi:hypothetical protein
MFKDNIAYQTLNLKKGEFLFRQGASVDRLFSPVSSTILEKYTKVQHEWMLMLGSCLICIICFCVRIVVSNTYCDSFIINNYVVGSIKSTAIKPF